MKRSLRISHGIAILVLLLAAGCSAPVETQNATTNNNAAPVAQADNTNAPAVTAQPATPLATVVPTAPTAPPTKPATEVAAKPATKETGAHVTGPKLAVVSKEKDLDFGKQPQDKTLVRPIQIKNVGSAVLNIESVSPS
jgi:hypothetical protein